MKKLKERLKNWFVYKYGRKILISKLMESVVISQIARIMIEKTLKDANTTNEQFIELKGLRETAVKIEFRIIETVKVIQNADKPLNWRVIIRQLHDDLEALKAEHLPPNPQMN